LSCSLEVADKYVGPVRVDFISVVELLKSVREMALSVRSDGIP